MLITHKRRMQGRSLGITFAASDAKVGLRKCKHCRWIWQRAALFSLHMSMHISFCKTAIGRSVHWCLS